MKKTRSAAKKRTVVGKVVKPKKASLKAKKVKIVFKGTEKIVKDGSWCICSSDNCRCSCFYPTNAQSTYSGVSEGRSTVMHNQGCLG